MFQACHQSFGHAARAVVLPLAVAASSLGTTPVANAAPLILGNFEQCNFTGAVDAFGSAWCRDEASGRRIVAVAPTETARSFADADAVTNLGGIDGFGLFDTLGNMRGFFTAFNQAAQDAGGTLTDFMVLDQFDNWVRDPSVFGALGYGAYDVVSDVVLAYTPDTSGTIVTRMLGRNQVPEPGTVALVGLGLLVVGAAGLSTRSTEKYAGPANGL
jgi:hypothetical protein